MFSLFIPVTHTASLGYLWPNRSRLLPHSGACLPAKTLLLISVLVQYESGNAALEVKVHKVNFTIFQNN